MNHRVSPWLALLALSCSVDTAAASATCVPRAGEPYKGDLPANLQPLPLCRNAPRMGPGEAHWIFRGRVTLVGKIRAAYGEWGETRFFPNVASRRQLPSTVQSVQLSDHNGDAALRLPTVNGTDEACFETEGTIEFSDLSVINDGTDSSGEWVEAYKVVSLKAWRKCQAQ